jgi:prevent-host-death family protein
MKFVTVRDLRLKPGYVWKLARKEKDVVITSNGRPVAILTGVDEQSFESELEAIRRGRALKALEDLHAQSRAKGTDTLSEKDIQSEIDGARKQRAS